MIDVIDYRAGNAPSVGYALDHLGLAYRLVSTPAAVATAERIVLPGVGAAAATLASLRDQDLVDALSTRVCDERVPFLGICIGLQVLFDHSEEGETPCLGWVPGTVRRFPDTDRVPQIGWNAVRFQREHPLVDGVPSGAHCVPADADDALGVTTYSTEFCSVVARDNIVATQFHAEKSGERGLALLRNFAAWEPSC